MVLTAQPDSTTPLFSTLGLKKALLDNLATINYNEMTPIQAKSLPAILANRDVIAQGKTGSGKTACFGLGLLNKLDVKKFRIQSLVLCPTRELADQVGQDIRKLGRTIHNVKVLTLCGGTAMGPQIGSLEHGAHIIVGTPGRIQDHLTKGRLNLDDLTTLVLDEADRMLDMGFAESLNFILSLCPEQRQTLLFSATFPDQIKPITEQFMKDPLAVKVESTHHENTINQHFYHVNDNSERMLAVRLLLQQFQRESTVIFCNTKLECQHLADELNNYGFSALALHGDLDQKERDQTLIRFANKSAAILVATDVAARGLDIDSLDAVINYHIAHDPQIHIHRIGRTGRAGAKGVALSLVSHKEAPKVIRLEEYSGQTFIVEELPDAGVLQQDVVKPKMVTLQIDGGKKQKLRPGDILGALTANSNQDDAISSDQVGKIQMFPIRAYVAVHHKVADIALKKISEKKMKGRSFRARILND